MKRAFTMIEFRIVVSAVALLCAILAAIVIPLSHEKRTAPTPVPSPKKQIEYSVVLIDGCEYIQWTSSYQYLNVTHKGNCTNVIHGDR